MSLAPINLKSPETAPDPIKEARLRYVSDTIPGIRRIPAGEHFVYVNVDGRPVDDTRTLERIRKLAIPPAYTDVWICPYPSGHLQATGRDARGRKQYRYHDRWRAVRDGAKYSRMVAFGEALPAIRRRVNADLHGAGLAREKVIATVVRLLEITHIRIGNEEYVRQNDSYGLTTLRNEHVAVAGSAVHFHFRGKSGKEHAIDIRDRRLARIVARCQELPEQELFEYIDADGKRHDIRSGDINDYLLETTGQEFTAKDFRTWAGTLLCATALREAGTPDTVTGRKQVSAAVIKAVSAQLGNTPAVCRQCYIHPAILAAYSEGSLETALVLPEDARPEPPDTASLTPMEQAVLTCLRQLGV